MFKKLSTSITLLILASMVLAACASAQGANGSPTASGAQPAGALPDGTQPVPATGQQAANQAAGSIQINGAGATFPLPVYTEWIYAYESVDPSVAINYQGIGSGGGKKGMLDRTLDFAGSDSLLKDAEYTQGGDLQMIPMIAGAVVPIYNIEGVPAGSGPALVLDRQSLADIYQGTIKSWNDPAIVRLNPDLKDKLPAKPITVVHRSDGSGTTEIFTNALSAFSSDWKSKVGAGTAVEWPVDQAGTGIGGKGNQGVAGSVQNTPNAIGYVELSYAVANKIAYAQMVNKAGKTVTADAQSLASAMNDYASAFDSHLTTTIVDGSGEGSWPIAGYTYIILHTNSMQDCAKADKLLSFLKWALTDQSAAQKAASLGYAGLPEAVQSQVLSKLGTVTCSGKPVLK